MTWEVIEIKGKIERINELKNMGFNTPNMYFVNQYPSLDEITSAIEWSKNIHRKNPNQIFNIRTYTRKGQKESLQTIHIVDIQFRDLKDKLIETSKLHDCMIDAETPDNGRYAGNIIIVTENANPKTYIIEYCKKDIRAMVRDHDIHISGKIWNYKDTIKYFVLRGIIGEVLKRKLFDKVLEWTYFCQPTGVFDRNTVWWEYRKY